MSRQHIWGYCAMILLFLSCELFAQDEAQDISAEAIKTTVKKYLQAIQLGKHADAVALNDFQDNKDRKYFEENLKKHSTVDKWDLEQELYVVQSKRKHGYTQALLLLPTKHGYLPERFSVRGVKGELKLLQNQGKKPKELDLDVISAKVEELRETLEIWKSVHGAALTKMTHIFKEQLQEEIDVLEYAEMKKLQIFSGYGSLASRRKIYEDIMNLSDENLQSKMIKEIQDALEALSP